jgi:hypothetical protein
MTPARDYNGNRQSKMLRRSRLQSWMVVPLHHEILFQILNLGQQGQID